MKMINFARIQRRDARKVLPTPLCCTLSGRTRHHMGGYLGIEQEMYSRRDL